MKCNFKRRVPACENEADYKVSYPTWLQPVYFGCEECYLHWYGSSEQSLLKNGLEVDFIGSNL